MKVTGENLVFSRIGFSQLWLFVGNFPDILQSSNRIFPFLVDGIFTDPFQEPYPNRIINRVPAWQQQPGRFSSDRKGNGPKQEAGRVPKCNNPFPHRPFQGEPDIDQRLG